MISKSWSKIRNDGAEDDAVTDTSYRYVSGLGTTSAYSTSRHKMVAALPLRYG